MDFVKRCFDGDFTSQEDMLKRFVDASVDKAAAGGMAQGKRVLLDDDYYGKVHAWGTPGHAKNKNVGRIMHILASNRRSW